MARGVGILVDEGENARVAALRQLANAEAEENAFLDPSVGEPAAVDLLSGTNCARRQRVTELHKRRARSRVLRGFRPCGVQALDGALKFLHGGQYNRPRLHERPNHCRSRSAMSEESALSGGAFGSPMEMKTTGAPFWPSFGQAGASRVERPLPRPSQPMARTGHPVGCFSTERGRRP